MVGSGSGSSKGHSDPISVDISGSGSEVTLKVIPKLHFDTLKIEPICWPMPKFKISFNIHIIKINQILSIVR